MSSKHIAPHSRTGPQDGRTCPQAWPQAELQRMEPPAAPAFPPFGSRSSCKPPANLKCCGRGLFLDLLQVGALTFILGGELAVSEPLTTVFPMQGAGRRESKASDQGHCALYFVSTSPQQLLCLCGPVFGTEKYEISLHNKRKAQR